MDKYQDEELVDGLIHDKDCQRLHNKTCCLE